MQPSAPSRDHHPTDDSGHQDEILRDLTIIQAQAQLVLRRIERAGYVDHDDAHRRLVEVVEAVKRLTLLHR